MTRTNTGDRLHEAPLLTQGTVVGGRFVVKRFIAQGGMGRVYVAEQQPMGRKVALKVMHKSLSEDDRAVKRFFREALVISKLRHPNTITLFDYGESEEGALFIAMEFLDGMSLKEVIAQEHPLPLQRVARIVAQSALSLAEAHRKGVIHRDLKPDNVFLLDVEGQPDFVKVIDFGIAQLRSHDRESRITQAGFVCGTPEYMAPEQARGEELDGRCDLYSLGILMYEMLEGSPPYAGDTPLAIVLKHQSGPVPLISERYPEPLRQFVRGLMATDPGDRPASAEEMLQSLREALPESTTLPGLDLRESVPRVRRTIPAVGSVPDRDTSPPKAPLDTAEIAETLVESASAPDAEPGPPGEAIARSRGRRWLFLAVGALLVACAIVVAVLGDSGPRGSDLTGIEPSAALPEAAGQALAGVSEVPNDTPDPVPPPQDEAMHESITVIVESQPEGARVHLDNAYVGVSPMPVAGTSGDTIDLLLTLSGYQDFRATVDLGRELDGTTLGPYELAPLPAHLHITSNPPGAEVFDLDAGESWGRTDLTREVPRSEEPVRLELRLPRYRTVTREVLPNRPDVPIHVELRRERRHGDEHSEPAEEPEPTDSPFGGTVD